MSVQKNKPSSGFGRPGHSQSQVRQGLIQSRTIAGKKVDNIPHSSYYLFDYDEDDLTTLGWNISGHIIPARSVRDPKENK